MSADVIEVQAPSRLFTVGIPVFNGRALLRACLESVVGSSIAHERFEVLLADDGSSEPETLAILEEFTQRYAAEPGFLRVISLGVNSGGAAARATGSSTRRAGSTSSSSTPTTPSAARRWSASQRCSRSGPPTGSRCTR